MSFMTSHGSKSRIKWEGNSLEEVRSWPKPVKEDVGLELNRLENGETPLDQRPMGKVLPGTFEIRTEDADLWYRLICWLHAGWIYVLHCFTKKTNKTAKSDINLAKTRMAKIKARKDPPASKDTEAKSA
jgi:phage-related protein